MSAVAVPKLAFSIERMVKIVRDARKDHLMIDFARQIGTRYADMVEHFSAKDGNFQSGHNNKTLYAEAIHLWFRAHFSEGADLRGDTTRDAREVIAHVMTPWYEAMSLDDPSRYRARLTPPPIFNGDYPDAVALELGACACLEVYPLQFRFGMENDVPVHVWGRVYAGGQWHDTDISQPGFQLGDSLKFEWVDYVEVPL
jgi:hypothetical protein